jgi:hypothetical protein
MVILKAKFSSKQLYVKFCHEDSSYCQLQKINFTDSKVLPIAFVELEICNYLLHS